MEIKEAVDHLSKLMSDNKAEISEKAQKAVDEANKIVKAAQDKFDGEVKALNENLAKKDATLLEIQGEVKELKAKKGRIAGQGNSVSRYASPVMKEMAIKQSVEDVIFEKKENLVPELKAVNPKTGKDGIEIKTVGDMSSANLTVDNYQTYLDWRPGMRPMGQIRFRDLVNTIQSATDFVQFPRSATPVGEGSFGRQATEAAAKAQVDYDFNMIPVTLTAMAGYAIVSRQALRNIIFLQSYLPQTMMEDLLDTEDFDFANKLVAGATGVATTAGITVNAERLIYFIKNQYQAKYNTSAIAMDPSVWASILVTKPQDYSVPGVVAIDPSGTVRILGRPIYPVNWLTGNRIIAGDWSKTAIVESEGLSFRQTDSHASTFIANQVTFLLERTHNLAIFRPDAFITTTLS